MWWQVLGGDQRKHADGLERITNLWSLTELPTLDVEDVLSKRQRPKIDEYPDYLFSVLHFPFYDKNVQRLNAA